MWTKDEQMKKMAIVSSNLQVLHESTLFFFPHSILQNNIIMLNPHKYIYTFKTIC